MDIVLDVHMMVMEPVRFIGQVRKDGADVISINHEAERNPAEALRSIKKTGAKADIVLKLETPLEALTSEELQLADVVQLMSVVLGFPDQTLFPQTLPRLEALRRFRQQNGLSCAIEVDGGILPENVGRVLGAGADIIVSGGGVFR